MLVCPSDSDNNGVMGNRANAAGPWGVNSYKGVSGSNWAWGSFTTIASAKGRHRGQTNGLDLGNGMFCRNGGSPNSTRIADLKDGSSNTLCVGEAIPALCSHSWWWWFNGTTANCGVPLNWYARENYDLHDWPQNYSFASRHVGGGHFLMGDGAVRFVSENIDLGTYRSLATISGGETTGDF